jgi:hypothetical protein
MRLPLGLFLAALCVGLPLSGCRSKAKAPTTRAPLRAVSDRPALLATLSGDERQPPAQPPGFKLHLPPAAENGEYLFSERGGGVAFLAERPEQVQVIHNGRAGRWYAAVEGVRLSPDGSRCAYGARTGGTWRAVLDDKEGQLSFSSIREVVFSLDGAHLAYQGMVGDLWQVVVDGVVKAETRNRYLKHQFSGDSSKLVYVTDVGPEDRGTLVVDDLASGARLATEPGVSSMLLNAERSRVAAISVAERRERIVIIAFDRPGLVKRGPPQDSITGLVFGADGASLAYVADRAGQRFVVLDDREAPLPKGDELVAPLAIRPDGKVVAALVASGGAVRLRQFFAEGVDGPAYQAAEGLVFSDDGRATAFAASRGDGWFLVIDGKEGPAFDRVVTPAFSPDGLQVVYRARKDGRRFVVVADLNGATMRQHPAYDQVFQVGFTADGRSTAYGVKDGPRLAWMVEAL